MYRQYSPSSTQFCFLIPSMCIPRPLYIPHVGLYPPTPHAHVISAEGVPLMLFPPMCPPRLAAPQWWAADALTSCIHHV